jgi:hypothetical protein
MVNLNRIVHVYIYVYLMGCQCKHHKRTCLTSNTQKSPTTLQARSSVYVYGFNGASAATDILCNERGKFHFEKNAWKFNKWYRNR